MRKLTSAVVFLGTLAALSGCGGSSSPVESTLGGDVTHFDALLPDGTPMAIVIDKNVNGALIGSFAVATETGPYARQAGSLTGTQMGNRIEVECNYADGKSFTLEGTNEGDKTLTLTRSDLPGKTLTFRPTKVNDTPSTRSDYTFFMDGGATKGRATLASAPYAYHNGTTIIEYRGKWNNLNITFWAYNSGYCQLVTYVDSLAVQTSLFDSYRIADLPTKTVTSPFGQIAVYNTTLKTQIKFKTTVTVSP